MKIVLRDIIRAALETMDDQGLASVNMRAVAQRLDVGASTLYWHIKDKNELLGYMATELYREPYRTTSGENWADWLSSFGHEFRKALLRFRDSAQLCAVASPVGREDASAVERLLAPIVSRGLSSEEALRCHAAIVSFTLGSVAYEQSRALHEHLLKMIRFEQVFDFGLRAMIEGFADDVGASVARNKPSSESGVHATPPRSS